MNDISVKIEIRNLIRILVSVIVDHVGEGKIGAELRFAEWVVFVINNYFYWI
jgi:hypothetical protein